MRISQPRDSGTSSSNLFLNQSLARQARRHRHGSKYGLTEHENHDRWMVSYADFITLLLAMFVVMYAISHVNEGKYRILTGSLVGTFSPQPERHNILTPAREELLLNENLAAKKVRRLAEAQRQRREGMEIIAHDITGAFAPFAHLIQNGQVRVVQSDRGVSVEINANVLFAPGQALLQEDSSRVLEVVAEALKDSSHAIQVEGHTDNIPIVTEKFPSNWELSVVRASSVIRLLIENGIAAKRLAAVGYGENRPVDSNDTEEGRTRNRRVTITVLSASPDTLPGASSNDLSDPLPESLPEPLLDTLPDQGRGMRVLGFPSVKIS
ncbi:MAG: flagellar motor protein MotD [Nitrosospira sp.]|nr:flagellar motor protein MotD [Nitrosospira sp.]